MSTEPGTDATVRDVQVYVRLSEQEHETIAASAKRDGMAPATWMRMQALRASGELRHRIARRTEAES